MLYIWPFFAFFSAPLFLPAAVNAAACVYKLLTSGRTTAAGTTAKSSATEPICAQPWAMQFIIKKLYLLPYYAATAVLSLLVVRFNTIIHPFTLADNRHYMFYIFRYTILRTSVPRWLLVVAYSLCRLLSFDVLTGYASSSASVKSGPVSESAACPVQQAEFVNSPFTPLSKVPEKESGKVVEKPPFSSKPASPGPMARSAAVTSSSPP